MPYILIGRTLILIYFCVTALMFFAQAAEPCGQCGMDLSKFTKTQYEIHRIDETVTKTCGVQCGLTQQLLHKDRFKSSMAKDYRTGKLFDAKAGLYVFGSKVVADMAPGFIAFQQRTDAEAFQKESGGRVLSLDEALALWSEPKARH